MRFESLKRWHWVLIALMLGFAVGYVRSMYIDSEFQDISGSLNTQARFERELTMPTSVGGQQLPQLKDISVYRLKDPRDPSKLTYIVRGKHLPPGSPRAIIRDKEGKWKVNYFPTFFLAPTPYTPELPIPPLPAGKTVPARVKSPMMKLAEALKLKEPDPANNVLDYLDKVAAAKGIAYTYSWWKAPRVVIAGWVFGCLVAIGGIWPTIVNLIAFGSFFRPPEEKPVLASAAEATAPTPKSTAPTAEDMDAVRAMGDALEKKLGGSVSLSKGGAPASAATPAPAPLRQLNATSAEPVQGLAQTEEEKHFDAKADDFYPVERNIKKKSE